MKEISIVLIGHKDHGKSTLIGRLLLDTQSIKESRVKEIQEVDKAVGQGFELAHLVDSFKEERERKMTMDTTSTLLKGKKRNYQLIDVPGHAELISQMLTGASGAEAALLIVAIEKGIKEQTRQHLGIANLLGIEQLGVIINKIDKVGYQRKFFDELVEKLKKVLKEIGYYSKNIRFFPISALKSDNVITKSSRTSWYSGPTLIEFLENEIREPESFKNLPLRFLVQDKYLEGEEEILVGRVESGKLKISKEILLLPKNKKDVVGSIKDCENELNEAQARDNVGITLKNKTRANRGTVVASLDFPPKVSNTLVGEIFWIKKPSQRKLMCECGTNRVESELQEPKNMKSGQKSSYKIRFKKPIVFDPLSKTILGKLVLKDKGQIIAVGNIRT